MNKQPTRLEFDSTGICKNCGKNNILQENFRPHSSDEFCYSKSNFEIPEFLKKYERRNRSHYSFKGNIRRKGDQCVEGCLLKKENPGYKHSRCLLACELCNEPSVFPEIYCGMCLWKKREKILNLSPQYRAKQEYQEGYCQHCHHLRSIHRETKRGDICADCEKQEDKRPCGLEHPLEPHWAMPGDCSKCCPWPG